MSSNGPALEAVAAAGREQGPLLDGGRLPPPAEPSD